MTLKEAIDTLKNFARRIDLRPLEGDRVGLATCHAISVVLASIESRPAASDTVRELLDHIAAIPIGWHDGRPLVARGTGDIEIVEWVQRLDQLAGAVRQAKEN